MMDFKGSPCERDISMWGVRWYIASPISYRQLEAMMGEQGVAVDHATLNRWVITYVPEVEKACRCFQRPVGRSGRLEETSVTIKGKWVSLYRAVDTEGHTIDILLTPTRDRDTAAAFLRKASRQHGLSEKITIAQSGSNIAVIQHYNKVHRTAMVIRQAKYLPNIVAQDHRAVKRLVRPLVGFNSFWAACGTIAGSEVRHAIYKGQGATTKHGRQTPAGQFYALAAYITECEDSTRLHLNFATKPAVLRRLEAPLPVLEASMERPVSLILIAVLAVIQGILGILRAFNWLGMGLVLRGRGVHALPILSAVAFIQGKLVLVLALLYILFASGALFGQRWAWGLGLGVSLATCLVVVVNAVLVGALMPWSLLWLIVPVVLVGYLLSPVGHQEFRR